MKRVFISYSWNDTKYNQRVVNLSNKLSSCGYNVFIDKREMQDQYSLDMKVMMHEQISKADKVIVLLSKGYKIKAEQLVGGVGQEFSLILTDIYNSKKKYILCCLDPFTTTSDIAPLAFQSRYIHCLSNESDYHILKDLIEDKLDYGVINGVEKLKISEQYVNRIYEEFLSDCCDSYFKYLSNAGRVYERITEYNVKTGFWNPENGWDNTCIYFIASRIKDKYDNQWTEQKTVEEVAHDICSQMEAYIRFMNSKRNGYSV